ncbi:MAG: radical SAM protein [Nanoarchaeota archaeon]
MKKITFVFPPLTMQQRYGKIVAKGGSLAPPLGLCNLAAVTRENNYETKIVDAAALNLNINLAFKEITRNNPDYVGFTASTLSINTVNKLAGMIKNENKDAKILLGGPHITADPINTIRNFKNIDIGIYGEAEKTVIELLLKLKNKKSLNKTKGIVFRKDKKIIQTEPRPLIKELDSLPLPAWDLLPDITKFYRPPLFSFKRLPSTSIVTSRGCPAQCIFCDRSLFGNILRGYSAEYVMKMIYELYHKYGIRDILIDDDVFTVFRQRTIQICNQLIKEKLDLTWSCNSRIDHVNPKILKLMKKSGCWQIAYGIESGSQKILNFIKKGITLNQIENACRWTREAGIRSRGFFMIGHPTETKETIMETINFARRIDIDDFQMTAFTPLPGAEVYKIADEYGTFNKDFDKMNMWTPTFIPKGLTKKDIEHYQKLAFRKFYLRPKIIYSYLKMLKNWNDVKKLLQGAEVLIKTFVD